MADAWARRPRIVVDDTSRVRASTSDTRVRSSGVRATASSSVVPGRATTMKCARSSTPGNSFHVAISANASRLLFFLGAVAVGEIATWKAFPGVRDLARRDRERFALGNGLGEQFALIRGTDLACGRQDQPAGAAACVRCQFGELEDIAELVALAQLALADRPGVGVGERNEALGDLLARQALGDLPADLLGQIGRVCPMFCVRSG